MNNALHIDFETRSPVDLRVAGLHNYARHPDTDVWCLAAAFNTRDVDLWDRDSFGDGRVTNADCQDALTHIREGGAVIAHNAPFELEIWNNIMVPHYGWPVLKPEQTYCTMAQAYAMGLPGALEDAALALGLSFLKDSEGRALMLRMARPRKTNPDGTHVWWDEPEKLARLYEYCKQDVRVERALAERLMPLSKYERRVWLMDYAINQRGVKVDTETAKAAVKMAEVVKVKCDDALTRITSGQVQTVTAVTALREWVADRGVEIESVRKQDVVDLLETDLPEDVRRALLLRQEAGKTSTAKFDVMLNRAGADSRLRQILQYHGAATGRWAARGVQVHNLPREVPPAATVEKILALVRAGNVDAIDLLYGPPLSVLSRCLRGFFVPEPGNVLIAGDFSGVEGRGTAWFSGEHWKVEAFRAADAKTGPGIYELAYAKAFHVPVESVKNPSFERQVGKVMELAFGYQGGKGAFRTMGSTLGVKVSDEQAEEYKVAWRAAHTMIKTTWYDLQSAAIRAVQYPGEVFTAGFAGRQVKFKVAGSFLWCLLPSGRALCYAYPKILQGEYGPQLTYMTVPSPDDKKKGKIIHDKANSANWARVATYGGSLMENVIQAMCRDLLVHVMLWAHDNSAKIVLHVHDEVVIEVAREKAEGARAALEQVMRQPPAWASGFPLWATPVILERYGK